MVTFARTILYQRIKKMNCSILSINTTFFMFTWLLIPEFTGLNPSQSIYIKNGRWFVIFIIAGFLFWYKGTESPLLQAVLLAFLIERPVYFILKKWLET